MLNLRRNDRFNESRLPLKPAIYEPPGAQAQPQAAPASAPTPATREHPPASAGARVDAATPTGAAESPPAAQATGSRLSIGVNIKLKGVEISDCDVMVIEGHAEATVHSHVMEIARPGTLTGTATIDVAEIHGEFSGELTARTRLVVHGTGRVSGIIRYGKLIVAEGGEINGDVRCLEPSETALQPARDAGAAVAAKP